MLKTNTLKQQMLKTNTLKQQMLKTNTLKQQMLTFRFLMVCIALHFDRPEI
jgi:hypothetical protein